MTSEILEAKIDMLHADMRALRSDMKYLIVAGIVASQVLGHIVLPQTVGYIGGVLVVALSVAKLAFSR